VAIVNDYDLIPIEAQAVAGIIIASLLMIVGSKLSKRSLDVSGMYGLLFPVVAIALIALPFITSPLIHIAASLLVFISYYISSINIRIIVCRSGTVKGTSVWVYLGFALGISALLILAGVVFGATILSSGDATTGLAVVSLVSLFVLALNPVIASRIGNPSNKSSDGPDAMAADPTLHSQIDSQGAHVLTAFSSEKGLTVRETEVLFLICQGRTRSYIADELGLSPNTVKGYIRNIYQKSNAHDKQDLLDRVELFKKKLQHP